MEPLTDAELDVLEKLHARMLQGSVLNDDGSVLLTHPHLTQAMTQAFLALPRLLAEVREHRAREAALDAFERAPEIMLEAAIRKAGPGALEIRDLTEERDGAGEPLCVGCGKPRSIHGPDRRCVAADAICDGDADGPPCFIRIGDAYVEFTVNAQLLALAGEHRGGFLRQQIAVHAEALAREWLAHEGKAPKEEP